jgi:hypothetical protein
LSWEGGWGKQRQEECGGHGDSHIYEDTPWGGELRKRITGAEA